MGKVPARVAVKALNDITKSVCLHSTIVALKTELDQFADGLDLFGILKLVRQHPNEMRSLFVYNEGIELTVDKMMELFQIKLSPPECNQRLKEEDVVQLWNEFIQDLAHGMISK